MINLPKGTVTFLFTDVERSTQSWERHPEAMRSALVRHDQILRSTIESHGGYVFKTIGDAFCAVFATGPVALRAVLAVQRALLAEDWSELGVLRVRAALHTGAADERDLDYFGPAINRVARLLSAGHGGQTLLSQTTYELVRDNVPGGVTIRDLGEHRLKDLVRPERIYQLVVPELRGDFPALNTLDSRPNNLPVQPTSLIGREREVEAATKRLRRPESRLLTLTGPGGIGKTRLALQVAAELLDEYDDGVYFVSLAPVGAPSFVISTIAQTLGVKETAGQSLIETLKDALRGRRLLLVLDNFEHLEAAAPLVADLLGGCPRLKVLVASRSALHVRGEQELAVPPLTLPNRQRLAPPDQLLQYEAVRLLVECAQAVKSDFALTSQNADAVSEICRRVDGLPLAIELAAARVKVLAPAEILERLGNRLRLLTGGARDLPARQQTLRNTIAWSYDFLEEEEKVLFRRLAAFTGGCTLAEAEAVCGDLSIDLLDGLTSLVDRSLLHRDEAGEEARFRMLETIQDYGLTLLAVSGEGDAIMGRHAAYFLGLVEEAVRLYTTEGPRSINWYGRLEPEQANLRSTLAWCRDHDPSLGLRLATGLGWWWIWRRDLEEGEGWLSTFLGRTSGDPEVRSRALLALATLKRDRGDLAAAQPLFEESLALCRQVGDRWGIGRCLIMLAHQARSVDDYDSATTLAEESLTIAREIRVRDSIVWALSSLAQIHRYRGDFARARVFAEETLRLSPRHLFARYQLGLIAEARGEVERAEALLQDALRIARERPDTAEIANILHFLGRLARRRGDTTQARQLFEESLAISHVGGSHLRICWVLYDLGNLAWTLGDRREGYSRLSEGLSLAQRVGNRQAIALGLLLAAQYSAKNGALVRAIRLFGAADLAIPHYRFELDSPERADYQQSLAEVRAALDADAVALAWAEGQAMTREQAVAYALEEEVRHDLK